MTNQPLGTIRQHPPGGLVRELEKTGGAAFRRLMDRRLFRRLCRRTLTDVPASRARRLDSPSRLLGLAAYLSGESRSHLLQDVWVLFETKLKRGGYFVDIGATDGEFASNTFLLEREFSWNGVVVEPNPVWQESLEANRSCAIDKRCVSFRTGEAAQFLCASKPDYSGMTDFVFSDFRSKKRTGVTIEVETVSLLDLLEQHGAPRNIDFISIDTEGSEFEILKSFDFTKHRVALFAVEHNFGPTRDRIYQLMTSNGYERVYEEFSIYDDWYISRDVEIR